MIRKPEWLRVSYNGNEVREVASIMESLRLNTVCKEANCPNMGECYRHKTATFMILGNECTRNCRFCNVKTGRPAPPDPQEPQNLAKAVQELGLKHVVITQVTRDDLPDGGASQFVACLDAIHANTPEVTVEVLISDMKGDTESLDEILDAKPTVFNHNVECVSELYSQVRPQANYARSLEVLRYAKKNHPEIFVKTGFMVGLGETEEQISRLMEDILETGCDFLTIGQYLQPSAEHYPLDRYVTPKEFEHYQEMAMEKGFRYCVSSPFVRSSYRAAEAMLTVEGRN